MVVCYSSKNQQQHRQFDVETSVLIFSNFSLFETAPPCRGEQAPEFKSCLRSKSAVLRRIGFGSGRRRGFGSFSLSSFGRRKGGGSLSEHWSSAAWLSSQEGLEGRRVRGTEAWGPRALGARWSRRAQGAGHRGLGTGLARWRSFVCEGEIAEDQHNGRRVSCEFGGRALRGEGASGSRMLRSRRFEYIQTQPAFPARRTCSPTGNACGVQQRVWIHPTNEMYSKLQWRSRTRTNALWTASKLEWVLDLAAICSLVGRWESSDAEDSAEILTAMSYFLGPPFTLPKWFPPRCITESHVTITLLCISNSG